VTHAPPQPGSNGQVIKLSSADAEFGPRIHGAISGNLVISDPIHACYPIKPALNASAVNIALIQRSLPTSNVCSFVSKVCGVGDDVWVI
jgi:hypothetical protein